MLKGRWSEAEGWFVNCATRSTCKACKRFWSKIYSSKSDLEKRKKNGGIGIDNVNSSCSNIITTWERAQVEPAEPSQHGERFNGRGSRRHRGSLESSPRRREIPQMGWGEWCSLSCLFTLHIKSELVSSPWEEGWMEGKAEATRYRLRHNIYFDFPFSELEEERERKETKWAASLMLSKQDSCRPRA